MNFDLGYDQQLLKDSFTKLFRDHSIPLQVHAAGLPIYGGINEIHHSLVAEQALGLPKKPELER